MFLDLSKSPACATCGSTSVGIDSQTHVATQSRSEKLVGFKKNIVSPTIPTYVGSNASIQKQILTTKLLLPQVNSTSDVVVVGEPHHGEDCAVGAGIPLQ